MPAHCPTCGRAYPRPKAAPIDVVGDTRALPEADAREYLKRIAAREDLRFWLRFAQAEDLIAQGRSLLAELEIRKATPKDRDRIYRLKIEDLTRRGWPFDHSCGQATHRHTSSQAAEECRTKYSTSAA